MLLEAGALSCLSVAVCRFTAEERTEVVNAKRDVGKDNTIGAYDNQWTKLMVRVSAHVWLPTTWQKGC